MRAFLATLLGIGSLASAAAGGELADISTVTVPKSPLYSTDKKARKQTFNMSGILCPADDWCLVVADEDHGVHALTLSRDAVTSRPDLKYARPVRLSPSPLGGEADFEAIASTRDHVLILGSHGNKRKDGAPNLASHVVAIAATDDLKSKAIVPATWVSLDSALQGLAIASSLGKPLQCGGINIEGATVLGADLYVGLRSPTPERAAYVVKIPLATLDPKTFPAQNSGKVEGPSLVTIDIGEPQTGVRAMETVGDQIVLVTGDAGVSDLDGALKDCSENLNPEDEDRPFTLRLWDPAGGNALLAGPSVGIDHVRGKDDDGDDVQSKLEGIAVEHGKPGSLILIYDSRDTLRYVSDAWPQ